MATLLSFLPQEQGIAIGKTATDSGYIDIQMPFNLKSTNLTNNTTIETNTSGNTFLTFSDMENTPIGQIESRFYTSGTQSMRIYGTRKMEDGTFKENGLLLSINSSGGPEIGLLGNRTKEAWHTALRPDVLFSGQTSVVPITLSASAANYSHMKIFYCSKIGGTTPLYGSVCVYNPNGKYVNLFIGESGTSNTFVWWKGWDIWIDGNTIKNRPTNRYYNTSASTSTQRTTTKNLNMYIDRVEAW